jgi:signal transduction histidine kinase
MKMFVCNDEFTQMETQLRALTGCARLPLLTALAWYACQRDTARALALAHEAEALLPEAGLGLREQRRMSARLHLTRAEAAALYAETNSAAAMVCDALQHFIQVKDPQGIADSYWLLGWIENDRGDTARRDSHWEAAIEVARQAGEALRTEVLQAALAYMAVFRDVTAAKARWGARFEMYKGEAPQALSVWINTFLGTVAALSNDFDAGSAYFTQVHVAALETGQIRRAIVTTLNIGGAFTKLNDHHSALDWMHRGLDLARRTGWPGSIGIALTQTAETLRQLGQLQLAQDLLEEAITVLAPLSGSRNYAVALEYLGDLALSRADYAGARDIFIRLQQRADALNQVGFQTSARRGLAHALAKLGYAPEALASVTLALTLAQAQDDVHNQIAALRVLAEIYSQYCPNSHNSTNIANIACSLPVPAGMCAPSVPLHYLLQARAIADQIAGYTIPGDLLDAIAAAYAAAGASQQAFATAKLANAARKKTHSLEATNHAIAMQVRERIGQGHAEAEYHRQLAKSEATRAEILQQTSASLERLGLIGQEVTANLDASTVFQVLSQHVLELLGASAFAIYLVDPDGITMQRAFGIESGKPLPPGQIHIPSSNANSAICMREQREVLVDLGQGNSSPLPGTLSNLSALYAPLTIGDRVLGVMAVQSQARHAYAERERLIFRTLCAYGAIALDNADAYARLHDAQAKLVEQEKLAALGALVAGVAHELNTPIGNSLMMASALQDQTRGLQTKMQRGSLRYSDLHDFLSEARESSALIMRGLSCAADLINSFKEIAVNRTSAQRRSFNLQQTSHEIVATMMSQIRQASHSIELDMPDNIVLNSYPGPLGQVITNLINNALLHGFDNREHGKMWLTASQPVSGRVEIVFRDNGVGIDELHLNRIFDPFFTTKLGQGGSGLGLNICYNVITSLLNGQISVHSTIGGGTRFVLDLPLSVPEPAQG